MNQWTAAAIVMACGFVPLGAVCLRADGMSALAALSLASVLTVALLVVLTVALRRQPFIDLAVVLVPASVVGLLGFVRFMERRR